MDTLFRMVAAGAAIPAGWMLGGLHRWASGSAAILELRVKTADDVIERQEVVHRLRRAATDPWVAAVLLRLEAPPGRYAACEDLRAAISMIRRAGRPVYAFVESPGNALMWIAAACDRVFCVPSGEVGLVGLGAELTFFGAALRRFGLTPDFEAAGAYKSFGEPFTRSFPSQANQEAMEELLQDLHRRIVADIASGRGLEPDAVRAAMERAPMSAQEAVDAGLVDQLLYEDQLEKWLEDHHGSKAKRVKFGAWAARDARIERVEGWGEGNKVVAVLHFEGNIVMESTGGRPSVQARKVVPILRKLREADHIAAVVLHVNSPGGHALAADLMWREVDEMARAKPVVACFEDVAASGGYYLAAPAAEIVARPATLTGSIGVFGGKVVAGEGLRKIGVHVHEVALARNATMYSPHQRFTDSQRERFRAMIERFYDGFVGRVAAGRKKPAEEVEPNCRGRVWTGHHALERGLVDRHGDVHDAVDRARALSGLHEGGFVRRDYSAEPKTWMQKQIERATKQLNPLAARVDTLAALLPIGQLSQAELALAHPGEPLALLPWDIRLR